MDIEIRPTPDHCTAEDLVALVYGELAAGSRTAIEGHLAVCDTCTGQLADISLARLSVYEWHRDEFADMKTPVFAIPFKPAAAAGWIDSLKAILISPMRWAPAGASFAAVLAVAAVWAYWPGTPEIAKVGAPEAVSNAERAELAIPEPKADLQPPVLQPVTVSPGSAHDGVVESEAPKLNKPVKSKLSSAQTIADRRANPVRSAVNERSSAPRLVDFDDEDDVTLRLGDLLADVDTRL